MTPAVSFEEVRVAAWQRLGLPVQPGAALAEYARRHNLGAPLTAEFDLGSYRLQGFAAGIVFAPLGRLADVGHIGW